MQCERKGDVPIDRGEQENLMIPLIRSRGKFDHAIGCGGRRAEEGFRREMGSVTYNMGEIGERSYIVGRLYFGLDVPGFLQRRL